MRLSYKSAAAAALVLAGLMLAACNSTDRKGNTTAAAPDRAVVPAAPANPTAHIAPADGVKRVTTIEARDAVANGTAVIVDVRPAQSYQQNHIKGSINIPLDQVETRLSELPRDKTIITYCS
jgi:3-mercaptopyruvate sulfurtransferase SseA